MTVLRYGSGTDVGRRRSLNEDAVLVGKKIWAVADGMGGHAAGDVASSLIVKRLSDLDSADPVRPADVVDTITLANQDVVNHARANPETWGLGSTVAGLAEVQVGGEPHWAIFNVGDSRVYRFWGGVLSRATVDHSEIEELILEGKITEEEARTHYLRNVITRSVGAIPPPQVDLWVLPQYPGETFLICSDGLTSELTDLQIAETLRCCPDPQLAVDLLIRDVLDAGARDNVSVIIVQVVGEPGDAVDETTNPRQRIWQGD
ncbi:MAG: protein phosphatase 2C domain-containing protein [Propionibacteriaceae bacterium]|nr:protein phosphatase 2C domain-containing protein [Propionibacteriaceae bacterium]